MSRAPVKPPGIASKIAEFLASPLHKSSILGDLEEEYTAQLHRRGKWKTKLWYWRQVMTPLPGYLKSYFYWSAAMLQSYFKAAVRNFARHKSYSLINTAGFAVGLTCFILITLYIRFELMYDRFHEKADNIYLILNNSPGWVSYGKTKWAITSAPLAPEMKREFPEVVNSTRIMMDGSVLMSHGEKSFIEKSMMICADPSFFEMFDFTLAWGDVTTALSDPFSMLISERMALKYFGDEDPVGKTITYREQHVFTVTGILNEIPKNSHLVFDFVIPFETAAITRGYDLSKWDRSMFHSYVLLNETTDPAAVEEKLVALRQKHFTKEKLGYDVDPNDHFLLLPLTSIHFDNEVLAKFSETGSLTYIFVLSSIGFLILAIAGINYMNLATARSGQRQKEVGIRKVSGAGRRQLINQFFAESITLALFAFVIALVAAWLLMPIFNELINREIQFSDIRTGGIPIILIAVTLLVGISGGVYPALYLSSFHPASIFRGGSGSTGGKGRLRNALVVFQFAVSIILITGAVIVRDQLGFIMNTDVGFSKDGIITVRLRDGDARNQTQQIVEKFKGISGVTLVAASHNLPNAISGKTQLKWPGIPDDVNYDIAIGLVDYDYTEVYGIDIVEGRSFSREHQSDAGGAFLLNEAAVKMLGWENPVGRELIYDRHGRPDVTGKVVGVMRDFNMHTVHHSIEPMYYYLDPDKRMRNISIKYSGNENKAILESIEKIVKEFSPAYPLEYHFFGDVYRARYRAEINTAKVFSLFAIISIIVACLGLFGLASYTVETRRKEVGVRKVLGANVSTIFMHLSKGFSKSVLIANLIAWPFAWYFMDKWLSNFVYHTEMSITVFIAASVITIVIALISVSFHVYRAARANPVDSLRYE